MRSIFKKIITSFILATFLMLVFFGALNMIHGNDGLMQGECPFSFAGTSSCIQNTVATAVHHISSYESFFNVTLVNTISVLLGFLLLLISLFLMPFFNQKIFEILLRVKNHVYNFVPVFQIEKKIIQWLSLFENSPSFNINV